MRPAAAEESVLTLESNSPEETERIGRALTELLPDGALVALHGDLGAGKTCFVRGMAQAIGAEGLVTSPTFTIVHEYPGPRPVIHLDLYRITDPRQVLDLGYEELFTPPTGVCVVEWPERAGSLLPARRVDVDFSHVSENERHLRIQETLDLPSDWKNRISSQD